MKNETKTIKRPPVVVIMGHIDHGKSTLLDYIQKSNVVAGESGGITQHLSAYEAQIKNENGEMERITFIDTPGHAAFSGMRERGANVADIAILIVSAEDSVKTQTKEAFKAIENSGIPYIVAVNKIDRPNANIDKVKLDLAEIGVLVEGYGGNISMVPISAKTGEGVNQLLELVLLTRDINEMTADNNGQARGFVIEANHDQKRGITATLIIKSGTLKKGDFIVSGNSFSTTRIIEDFSGKSRDSFSVSMPVKIIGFDKTPNIGDEFVSFDNKKTAEKAMQENISAKDNYVKNKIETNLNKKFIPIVIKADVSGTEEAIRSEIEKLNLESVAYKIISSGVGQVSEADIKTAQIDDSAIIVCFKVGVERKARELNEFSHVAIHEFDIIYKLIEFLQEHIEEKRPREMVEEIVGKCKILKTFSATKDKQVVGARVTEGKIVLNGKCKIFRRENELGKGVLTNLEHGKMKKKELEAENECGMQIETKVTLAQGDVLEFYINKEV